MLTGVLLDEAVALLGAGADAGSMASGVSSSSSSLLDSWAACESHNNISKLILLSILSSLLTRVIVTIVIQ